MGQLLVRGQEGALAALMAGVARAVGEVSSGAMQATWAKGSAGGEAELTFSPSPLGYITQAMALCAPLSPLLCGLRGSEEGGLSMMLRLRPKIFDFSYTPPPTGESWWVDYERLQERYVACA